MLSKVTSRFLIPNRSIGFGSHDAQFFKQAPHVEGPVLQKHQMLQAEMNEIGADKLGLKSALLLAPNESPKVIRHQYLSALEQLKAGDLKRFTQGKLLGLMEEMGDVAHATTLKLASQTVLHSDEYKAFEEKARPILKTTGPKTLESLWKLASDSVNELPWSKSKGFVDFSKINGYQPGVENSLPTHQLKTFLKLCFFDYALRTHCEFPHNLGSQQSLKKNVNSELDEFVVNAERWAKQQPDKALQEKVHQQLVQLNQKVVGFTDKPNAQNLKQVYSQLVGLGKTMFALDSLTIGELFEGAILKHRGRLAGQFLDNAAIYRGKAGYDSGKQIVKPLELVMEAAALKQLLQRSKELPVIFNLTA